MSPIPLFEFRESIVSLGGDLGVAIGALTNGTTPASTVWPAANDALFIPFTVKQPLVVKTLFSANGTAVSGNIDLGIYTKGGKRIVSSGSIAHAGTSVLQFYDFTDFILGQGLYYMALAVDNTTATFFRSNLSSSILQCVGVAKQASAFPLPATATFATVTANYLPLIGVELANL